MAVWQAPSPLALATLGTLPSLLGHIGATLGCLLPSCLPLGPRLEPRDHVAHVQHHCLACWVLWVHWGLVIILELHTNAASVQQTVLVLFPRVQLVLNPDLEPRGIQDISDLLVGRILHAFRPG
uniref:Putative secreted protein n=1 Tax=Ixodes ricinus TaxID=34613 RepID=A0A6B0UNS3_IXORI